MKRNATIKASIIKTVCSVLLVISILCLPSCPMRSYYESPGQQPNTQWISEDGRFFIDSKGTNEGYVICYGIIEVKGQKIPIGLNFGGHTNIDLLGVFDEEWTKMSIESWTCHKYYENGFTVNVSDENSEHYFEYEAGEKIKFRKLDESEKVEFDISNYSNTDYDNNIHMIAEAIPGDSYSNSENKSIQIKTAAIRIELKLLENNVGRIKNVEKTASNAYEFDLEVLDDKGQKFIVSYSIKDECILIFQNE